MTKQDFKKKFKDIINQHVTKVVEGKVSCQSDRDKADFNGVYLLIDNDNIIYVGSAYPSSFPIKKRLYIHYNSHDSNSCLARHLMREEGWTREQAKEYIGSLDFIALEHFSLEYYLIDNITGLKNLKGYKNN